MSRAVAGTCAAGTARSTASCARPPATRPSPPSRRSVLRGDHVGGDPGRLPDAADERHRVPRGRPWTWCPQARRALLTAYADTDAAIAAINVVDVDHYLLKPWEPPEEKLYPVVDDLLESPGGATATPPVHKIKILGHPWSAPSYEVRDFLARNQVPYRWYRVDEAEGERMHGRRDADAPRLPVVITADGTPLVAPSLTELADAVGLSTTPAVDFYDLVIIGGGPAGLGAAVYGASEGLRTVLIERQCRRRPGRAELADRELPGLPRRRLRWSADRSGAAAGPALRRRDHHRPDGRRPRSVGAGPRRCSSTTDR